MLDKQNIKVLNYNQFNIYASNGRDSFKFSASKDGITPSVLPMHINDLISISSNSEVIKVGLLTFEEEEKEEIFKELRIPDWKDILTDKDIRNILLNPTIDGLQSIIDIKNTAYFDRVSSIMFELLDDGDDVTEKVARIIKQRYRELQNRQLKSSIVLREKDAHISTRAIDELAEQNKNLQSQLEEMQKMMMQLMAAQSNTVLNNSVVAEDTVEQVEEPIVKTAAKRKSASKAKKTTTK